MTKAETVLIEAQEKHYLTLLADAVRQICNLKLTPEAERLLIRQVRDMLDADLARYSTETSRLLGEAPIRVGDRLH